MVRVTFPRDERIIRRSRRILSDCRDSINGLGRMHAYARKGRIHSCDSLRTISPIRKRLTVLAAGYSRLESTRVRSSLTTKEYRGFRFVCQGFRRPRYRRLFERLKRAILKDGLGCGKSPEWNGPHPESTNRTSPRHFSPLGPIRFRWNGTLSIRLNRTLWRQAKASASAKPTLAEACDYELAGGNAFGSTE
jgi:hypothetical protein